MFLQDYESFKRRCIGTKYKFVWIPKRCCISNKILWLTHAYTQTAVWSSQGDVIYEERWYDKNEFLFAKTKDLV